MDTQRVNLVPELPEGYYFLVIKDDDGDIRVKVNQKCRFFFDKTIFVRYSSNANWTEQSVAYEMTQAKFGFEQVLCREENKRKAARLCGKYPPKTLNVERRQSNW